jgi:hypothetical protein
MTASELLERLAVTLRSEVAPAVAEEYPRTQAFLTAVVLQKLAGELRLAASHAAAGADERVGLERDLRRLLDAAPVPPSLQAGLDALPDGGDAALCRFIEVLYGSRRDLGDARFATLLGRVRETLRAGLDRRMEFAS